jgi:pimeloyl-ACP methyl ester carboxylesterase
VDDDPAHCGQTRLSSPGRGHRNRPVGKTEHSLDGVQADAAVARPRNNGGSDTRSLAHSTSTGNGTAEQGAGSMGRSEPHSSNPLGGVGEASTSDSAVTAPWLWRQQRIAWCRAGCRDATDVVLLIHGFGASQQHWRHTIPALAERAEVFALDLLGFGASDKPPSRLTGEPERPGAVRYCFDLWASQVVDFLAAKVSLNGRRLHLIGNSVGAMVALRAALMLQQAGTAPIQVVLIDCAQRTLDRKRLAEQPALQRLVRPWLEGAVRQRWLLGPLFRLLARPAFIRQVLAQAYPSGGHVDAELVELLHRPSTDPGALESFRGFVNLFDDHLAPQLLAQLDLPVRMLWGADDPWEDPAEARRWAEAHPCVRELQVLEGLGHCPHDEAPERVNPILLRWLAEAAGLSRQEPDD